MLSTRGCLLICTVLALLAATATSLDNGLARTPQMGWNSWNKFQCAVDEQVLQETAKALVSTGLAKLGYVYLNVDDCWAKGRFPNGSIYADPVTFPSGMSAVAAFAHSLHLKFGLYSDAGNLTCAGRPGSLGHESQDAQSYASWGVDYLKYDNCASGFLAPQPRYQAMHKALNNTGRPIFFSACEWGKDEPATFMQSLANSWRTTVDIQNSWDSIVNRIELNNQWSSYAGPGGWNDPDMLEVGNGALNPIESRSHFSLWCIAKAPLLIGCDVRQMDADTLTILSNEEAIAVNQDPLGVQGSKVWASDDGREVWAGPLADGSVAVLLFSRQSSSSVDISFQFPVVGLSKQDTVEVRDLWLHKSLGTTTSGVFSASVQPHGVRFLRLTPQGK